jgi:hypothetical protein
LPNDIRTRGVAVLRRVERESVNARAARRASASALDDPAALAIAWHPSAHDTVLGGAIDARALAAEVRALVRIDAGRGVPEDAAFAALLEPTAAVLSAGRRTGARVAIAAGPVVPATRVAAFTSSPCSARSTAPGILFPEHDVWHAGRNPRKRKT